MSGDRQDERKTDPTAPTGSPAGEAAPSEGLQITLRAIDVASPVGTSDAPKQQPESTRRTDPLTLSGADWLDTIIDEFIDGGAREVKAGAAAPVGARAAGPAHKLTEFADLSVDRSTSQFLRQVLLGYAPVIEPSKGVIATRLTVAPVSASAAVDAGALLEAIAAVWPTDGGIVSLNVASETLLTDVLRARPAANLMIEVPAFVAANPANARTLLQLAARDCVLLLKGKPLQELPREVLPCFKWSIIDITEERRDAHPEPPRGVTRTIPHIQSGVRTMAQLRRSFALGAIAVIGWPLHEPIADMLGAQPDMRVVMDVLQSIDQGGSADAVDHMLMRDPVLAFELLHHINSADTALAVETRSMQHAVSILGLAQLRRWLAGLLSRSSDDIALRPANFAALRRGLLMRMLATGTGQQERRNELFMCGVFSLLDRIYARPVGELVQRLSLPEQVRAALVDRSGPYFPLLELARAIESEVPHDIRLASEAVFVQPGEINTALLRSLLVASHLERPLGASRA